MAEARRADILGVLQAKQIRGKTSVPLRIRSEAREPLTVQYRLVLPRELVADVTTGAVTVAAGGQATVAVAVDNFSALPKSEYGLHAVLEYEADGRHFTTVASGSVQVVPPRAGLAWYFWVVAAVVLAAIAVSFIPRGAKRPTGAAQPQARPEPDA